jgi:hypothetical protein
MARKYTLEQIREFIACPELGDDHYGKWGAMTREQRLVMNDLIEIAKEYEDFMQARANARRGTEKVYIDPKFATSKEEIGYMPTFRFIEEEQA